MFYTKTICGVIDSVFNYFSGNSQTQVTNRTIPSSVLANSTPLEEIRIVAQAPSSSTREITQQLGQPHEKKTNSFALTPYELRLLGLNGARDLIWSITGTLGLGAGFGYTNNRWGQYAGQQVLSSIAVAGMTPIVALITSRVFKEDFRNALVHAGIISASALAAIMPWNLFSLLGSMFFKSLGYDEKTAAYLAALFPGPGTADGLVQALTNAGLSFLFDPDFKFNPTVMALNLSPINYISGNVWLAVYTAMADIAAENTGGLIGQALVVASTVAVVEYFTIVTINTLAKKLKNKFECCNYEIEGLNLFGLNKKIHHHSQNNSGTTLPTHTDNSPSRSRTCTII